MLSSELTAYANRHFPETETVSCRRVTESACNFFPPCVVVGYSFSIVDNDRV